jgi:dTDP-4-amino-4,6-dideoxygalactose transaminase
MINTNFSSWPNITDEEVEAVSKVLLSNKLNYWTGEEARSFEKEFADHFDSKYAIALNNGTAALEAALKNFNLNPDDEVIVTSRTFIASVSSIVNAGAKPVFADVNRNNQNIDINTIKPVYSKKTKGIICVHLAGWPCDMDPIMEFARAKNLFVIEDCSQAHGAKYKGKSVGSIGDIGCWSFCQDKIMTTGGEGGMVTTNDYNFWSKMWSYKDHGKSWEAVYKKKHPSGFKWLHETFGTNFRMTEMQAVIGRIQLKRISKWSKLRRANAQAIWDTAKKLPGIRVPNLYCHSCKENCENHQINCLHAAYKCYIFVEQGEEFRDQLLHKINNRGVPCYSGSCSEVYQEKAFKNNSLKPKNRLSIAKELGQTSLMFLCHPTLKKEEVKLTCRVLKETVLEMMG